MAPDFAIEVRSPAESWEATVEMCGIWIAHGSATVWGVDPKRARIAVFRQGRSAEVHEATGVADAAPALPGFHLAVESVFAGL